jgi:hypothetical protein
MRIISITSGALKTEGEGPKYYPLSVVEHSSDANLFQEIVNQGIDAHLQGFTKSQFVRTNGRIFFRFEFSEIPILLRRLREKGGEEAAMWADDIERDSGVAAEDSSQRRELALKILEWHGGQSDPIYAVGSSWLAELEVPKEVIESAILELRRLIDNPKFSEKKAELQDLVNALQKTTKGVVAFCNHLVKKAIADLNVESAEETPDFEKVKQVASQIGFKVHEEASGIVEITKDDKPFYMINKTPKSCKRAIRLMQYHHAQVQNKQLAENLKDKLKVVPGNWMSQGPHARYKSSKVMFDGIQIGVLQTKENQGRVEGTTISGNYSVIGHDPIWLLTEALTTGLVKVPGAAQASALE